MEKPVNQKAWLMVLPVVLVAGALLSAIIPLMTVVNYSVQDTFGRQRRSSGSGTELVRATCWTRSACTARSAGSSLFTVRDPRHRGAAGRRRRAVHAHAAAPWSRSAWCCMALPLLIPWNVVGTIWQIFGRAGHRPARAGRCNSLGFDYNYTSDPVDAWVTLIVMDVWHWTSLVVLLCYAGLQAIPDAYYQAARVDGASRWAVFRYIELPKMRGVLTIAILLRFMDSFKIYTEPFVLTGGGPGNATTLLSIDLVKMALGQFNLGRGGRHSHHLLPDHPDGQLGLLHRHDQHRTKQGSCDGDAATDP
ncbi:MAG: sugar ABC transporter permease [Halofilum sp. (in: g-proteobacteria)]|nr:sugar ABC transporter permease [Halofilum sp. (in: g-proteobacteria)]